MRSRRRRGNFQDPAKDLDFSRALEAMTAPELRAFVRGVLDELDPDARTAIVDALVARAVKGRAGWKPSRPAQRVVSDAKSFAEAARVVGYADAVDVSEHLRLGGKAFLAGDHATARGVFEALLDRIGRSCGRHGASEGEEGAPPLSQGRRTTAWVTPCARGRSGRRG